MTLQRIKEISDHMRKHAVKPWPDGNYYIDGNGNPIPPPEPNFTHDDGSPSTFDHNRVPCAVCTPNRKED